jgi:hypothetical protein
VGAFQARASKCRAVLGQIVVRPGVIALLVARISSLPHQVRNCLCPLADPEERRLRGVPLQDRQHLRRPLTGRAVIDGEREEPGRRRGTEYHRRRIRPRP